MAIPQDISYEDGWFKNNDDAFTFFVTTGMPVKLSAQAVQGETTILVEPLKKAIANAAKLRFGEMILTLTAAVQVGDTSIPVAALTGTLAAGSVGAQIQDITGWTIEWVLKDYPGALTDVMTKAAALTTPADGVCTVTISATETVNLTAKEYVHRLRRTDNGNKAVVVYGKAILRNM